MKTNTFDNKKKYYKDSEVVLELGDKFKDERSMPEKQAEKCPYITFDILGYNIKCQLHHHGYGKYAYDEATGQQYDGYNSYYLSFEKRIKNEDGSFKELSGRRGYGRQPRTAESKRFPARSCYKNFDDKFLESYSEIRETIINDRNDRIKTFEAMKHKSADIELFKSIYEEDFGEKYKHNEEDGISEKVSRQVAALSKNKIEYSKDIIPTEIESEMEFDVSTDHNGGYYSSNPCTFKSSNGKITARLNINNLKIDKSNHQQFISILRELSKFSQ